MNHAPIVPPTEPRTPDEVAAATDRFRRDFSDVRDRVSRVMVGQSGVIEGVLTCLFVGGHVLLEGVPGIGKTLLVRTLSRALSLSFGRVQFTPDLMPADISGTTIVVESEAPGGGRHREFRFQPGPIFAQIVLADEVNRATPKTQSALLEAMQERSVTVGTQTHRLPEPFIVLATQNPIEQEGTYPLPEAQLDRFFYKLIVGVSGRAELHEVLNRTTGASEPAVEPVLDAATVVAHQRLVRRIPVASHVQDYAVRLVLATQPASVPGGGEFATPMVNQYVRLGASPRAAQAMILAAKCRAIVEGRAAASIEDLRAAALPALRHRLIMNFEASAEGITPDSIISNLIATLPADVG